jgi:hypothetical protein
MMRGEIEPREEIVLEQRLALPVHSLPRCLSNEQVWVKDFHAKASQVRGRDILRPGCARTQNHGIERSGEGLGIRRQFFQMPKKTQPRMARLAASRQRPTASNHIKRTDF